MKQGNYNMEITLDLGITILCFTHLPQKLRGKEYSIKNTDKEGGRSPGRENKAWKMISVLHF